MGSNCVVLTLTRASALSMAEQYKRFSSSSCEDWKMTRYISGISIIRFASFLAWTGLVCSLIFILGGLDLLLTPLALALHHEVIQSRGSGYWRGLWGFIFGGSLYVAGSLMLITNIGSYIMGALELVTCVASGVITPIIVVPFPSSPISYGGDNGLYAGLLMIPVVIHLGFIALISLMIHGVRKFRPGLVNVYIIFKIVIFTLFAMSILAQVVMGVINIGALGWLLGPNMFLLCGFFYFYSSGFMVAQYNIMLGRPQEQDSLDLGHSPPQFSNNVYFNEDTNNQINSI